MFEPDPPYVALLFDLLTALLNSWSLWNAVAGDPERGRRWRLAYLRLTYATGAYRPYETLIAEAAWATALPPELAQQLVARWDELTPWPEAPAVLDELRRRGLRLGVVTNCSEALGRRAAGHVGVPLEVVVTAERAGWYKPHPGPYAAALAELGTPPAQTLFVAGAPARVPGAAAAGLPVAWHNRLGLPLETGATPPRVVLATLDPLLDLI